MAPSTDLYLFGDQTFDFVPTLRELLSQQDTPLLSAFLEQAHYVARAQMVTSLGPAEHKVARTADLAQMVQKYATGSLSPAFQTALSCICQLGVFMREFELSSKPYPRPSNTYVLGVCTGSLAAAAVSCSSSLSELLPIAVQTVLLAFRLGLCVTETRNRLETSTYNRTHPWSAVVSNLDHQAAEAAIELFAQSNVVPATKRPWISANAAKATTISGPPSTLAKFLASPPLAHFKSREIPIMVPSHTSRIFTPQDIRSILETTSENTWSGYSRKLPFISSVSSTLALESDYLSLIKLALGQCLLDPIGWDKVESELDNLLLAHGTEDLITIRPVNTSAHRALAAILSSSGKTVQMESGSGSKHTLSHRPSDMKSKLAIVAMSGRFPEAQNTDSFWDLLHKGLDVVKEVPARRWNVDTHVDPTGKARNKGATKWGCWLDFTAEFDPRFFSISPKEAPQMDPAQRMALMSTYEAMERGGIVPDTTPSTQRNRIGVFHGVTSNDWMETNTAQNIDTYFITGGNRGFIPGRINFCFEFSGPSYTNDTACSSSLAAIHLACNSLWRGDCDTAVAGGTNMIFTPDGHAGLDKGFFLSRTGNCKAFDDKADGYCRAEGVGTVFIKRLEDALADNDPILATVLDAKTNHSAMSESMTRPHAGAQIDNMTAVLNTANVSPNSLSYIEMHGTGTQVGDAEEMKSVLACFAPNEGSRGNSPLHVGSAKANVGHGEGVSGITSLIKVLLMMKHETIPPHCGIKPGSKINRNYPDLAARNVHIAFEPQAWPRTKTPRRVLINNFSAAGGNTALLLEDAPERSWSEAEDPRTSHVVNISGHVGKSLKSNAELLLSHLETNNVSLAQLSYTTTARRWHHLHRIGIIGSTLDEIKSKLKLAIDNGSGINRPKFKPSVVFAFTGQGSQYLGMGKQLYESYPKFQADIRRFNQLAQSHGFSGFVHIYTTNTTQADVDIASYPPVMVQLAILCLQMALGNLLLSFGIQPHAVIGHSLGEYAALNIAGVLSASDAIYLVGKRAELLQARCQRGTHAMLATKASSATMSSLLKGTTCEISCINGPDDTVVSGPTDDIAQVQGKTTALGFKSTLLELPYAFHSAQVDAVLTEFETLATGVDFEKPSIPLLSPLQDSVVEDAGVLGPSYLARHCRERVNFVDVLHAAKERSIISDRTVFIEIGPKPLVCGMIKATLGPQTQAFPTLKPKGDMWYNLQTLLTTLYTGGMDLDWTAYHEPFESAKKVLELPSYAWDLKEYYIEYEGDWCLHRHKIHCNCAEGDHQWETSKYQPGKHDFKDNVVGGAVRRASKLDETKEAYPTIGATTTVHRVIEETTEPLGATLIVETDMSRKDVNDIAKGHTVDGIPLATPSFYADIAYQVGKYSMDRIRAGHKGAIDGLVDVCDMVVDKALIPHGEAPQLLRTTLTMSWPPKAAATTRSAKVKFATYFKDGKLDTEHATCTVRFTTDAQQKSVQKRLPEYQSIIQRLRHKMNEGKLVKYNTKSGYKLMSSMARFHPDYKLLDKLILNESDNEAISTMDFSRCQNNGTYALHPAHIDAITQVGGFAMNAKDDTDIEKEVYVNHGWDSLQVYEPLVKTKHYQVYSKMTHDATGEMVHGDTLVLDGDNVVAFFKGLSLRCVPRKALGAVLQSALGKGIRQRGGKPAANPASKVPTATAKTLPTPPKTADGSKVAASNVAFKPAASNESRSSSTLTTKIDSALKIVAEESGIAPEELTEDCNFTDMGIDSLSSIVISSRLREDLDLDLDPEFSLFASCPTVKSLRDLLSDLLASTDDLPTTEETTSALAAAPEQVVAPSVADAAKSQPEASASSSAVNAFELVTTAIEIIAAETGVAAEDFTDETDFVDMGIDSLCSIVISSRFREELDLDLDPEFSLFVEIPNVGKLKEFLAEYGAPSSEPSSDTDYDAGNSSPDDDSSQTSDGEHSEANEKPDLGLTPFCRPTTSVILQGMPTTAKKTLFMLPDGGGSASSYMTIPRLAKDVAMVGLNCPYARDPENMNCTHTAMIESFVNEIRRRQPEGPYHLGGWSSGGAFAYVTAEALVNQGDEVDSLVIIDAPVPQVMEKLPVEFYEHCNGVGLFSNQPGASKDGSSQPPSYLIPHFMRVVDVMLDYEVAPLETKRMPKVGLIWAADTVMEEESAPKMKGMHFMVQKRTDFGPDGWETVMPGADFDIVKADNANHFTLMTKDKVHLVKDAINRVMA